MSEPTPSPPPEPPVDILRQKSGKTSVTGLIRSIKQSGTGGWKTNNDGDDNSHVELLDEGQEQELLGEFDELLKTSYPTCDPAAVLQPDQVGWWKRACLRSRRYRVSRAVDLFNLFVAWRKGIRKSDRERQHLVDQLSTRFLRYIKGARCREGRGILVVELGHHDPSVYTALDTVHAIVSVLEMAIRDDEELQLKGFTIIHNLAGFGLKNMDHKLPKQAFETLNACFPIRYGSIIVHRPPMMFSMLLGVVSMFLSKKMRERIHKVGSDPAKLLAYVDEQNLPTELGGAFAYEWNDVFAGMLDALE